MYCESIYKKKFWIALAFSLCLFNAIFDWFYLSKTTIMICFAFESNCFWNEKKIIDIKAFKTDQIINRIKNRLSNSNSK